VQDEVLLIIYLINRRLSLQGSVLQAELTDLLHQTGIITSSSDDPSAHDDTDIQLNPSLESLDDLPVLEHSKIIAKISYGNALCMLLHLKHFLKQWYNFSDEQCQSFSPHEMTKANERGVAFIDSITEFQVPKYQDMDEIEIPDVISYYQTFKKLMQQDPADFTLNVKADRRRGRKASIIPPAPVADENTSLNGNIDPSMISVEEMDGDFEEPASRKRRRKSTAKSGSQRKRSRNKN